MPPTTRKDEIRFMQAAIGNTQQVVRGVATSQQGGLSGQIPGTSSDPTQIATQYGTIMPYPNGTSPQGDSVAGIGHQVLNSAGNPVVVMGNLDAPASTNHGAFQDGGFAFVDANGNHPAGYSQPTGLWGFGPTVNGYTDAKTIDFTGSVSVSESSGVVTVDVTAGGSTAFYLWGAAAIYQGASYMLPNTPYPSNYFPSGINYNKNPGIDHDTFGGTASGSFLWNPGGVGYDNSNPVTLVYGGPTDPSSISGVSCQLRMTAYTVGSGGYTVVADGSATPTGWTYSPNGNLGPYTGLWMTYTGLSGSSQLSWSWNTSPVSPVTLEADGSFTVTSPVMVNMAAVWTGYMS